jgi:phosphoenolpyruvate synthase/pyruvate phosphate dikinase
MEKYVYDFAEGNKDMKDLLGGKGANLAEMTNLGLPVPAGFTITTEACQRYLARGTHVDGLDEEIDRHLAALEQAMGRKLGDPADLGTAVNVVAMVFGNLGPDSGTGVAFTRDPATGESGIYGDYLQNAQGEDVVAGIRNTLPLADLEKIDKK